MPVPRPTRGPDMTLDGPVSAGLLVVRVWREGTDRTGFRAHITTSLDLLGGAEQVTTTTDPETVVSLVRDWLDALRTTRG